MIQNKWFFLMICFVIFSFGVSYGQFSWHKLTNEVTPRCFDMTMDKAGMVYFSLEGSPDIHAIDLTKTTQSSKILPRFMSSFFFKELNSIHLAEDNGIRAFVTRGILEPYILANDQFVIDVDTPVVNFYCNRFSKSDVEGNLYFNELSSIYKYQKKWDFDQARIVFKPINNAELIYQFYIYKPDINYAITSIGNGCRIYQFSGETNQSKLIYELFNTNVKPESVFIFENGVSLIPSLHGLFRYNPSDSQEMHLLIDTSFGSAFHPIEDFRLNKSQDKIYAKVGQVFYESSDTGSTWRPLINFSNHFPPGTILKLEILDSLHASTLVLSDCSVKKLFVLNKESKNWESFIPIKDYSDLHQLFIDQENNLIAKRNNCFFETSVDDGKNWKHVLFDSFRISNLLINNKDDYFTFKGEQIFRSINHGLNWELVFMGSEDIITFGHLSDQIFFAICRTPDRGTHYFIVSLDGGESWQKYTKGLPPAVIGKYLIMDPDGNILAYDGFNTPLKSTDLGLTWQIDTRFLYPEYQIGQLQFTQGGKMLLSGQIKNERGIFISDDFIKFEKISGPYGTIHCFHNDLILAYHNFGGIKYTNDLGRSWIEIVHDLPLDTDYILPVFNDAYLSNEGHMYLSIGDNGIYKSSLPFVSTEDIQKDHLISIYPNPTSDQLTVSLNKDYTNFPVQFVMQNMLGQKILEKELLNSHNNINLNHLPAGIYAVAIYHKGTLQHREMLMKK